ncbi:phosphonate ABC transporter permease protein [Streptomyces lydicamycinicus]|uniref:Phosphonate ABC transporter permease protein n=1 Tax=Streptomyces lydicamycinicus TaxID=1546107 RepID=A0A0P4R962_9ACTN|nr:phosphonate ABC transporter permease protein [Streptomyces lydicamycinicus]
MGGGFTARKDIKATDTHAAALAKIMKNVDIFHPDWNDLDKNLDSYVEAWREATGG